MEEIGVAGNEQVALGQQQRPFPAGCPAADPRGTGQPGFESVQALRVGGIAQGQDLHDQLAGQLAAPGTAGSPGRRRAGLADAGIDADEHLVGVRLVEVDLLGHLAQLVHGQGPARTELRRAKPRKGAAAAAVAQVARRRPRAGGARN